VIDVFCLAVIFCGMHDFGRSVRYEVLIPINTLEVRWVASIQNYQDCVQIIAGISGGWAVCFALSPSGCAQNECNLIIGITFTEVSCHNSVLVCQLYNQTS
jgi:hypothetical protein